MMIRDSFSNELLPFLYPHFSRIILTANGDGFWRPDLIERFKPDIVILEVVEGGLRVGVGGGPDPSPAAVARIDHVLAVMRAADPATASFGTPTPATAKALAAAKLSDKCSFDAATLKSGRRTVEPVGRGLDLGPRAGRPGAGTAFSKCGAARTQLIAKLRIDQARPDVARYFDRPSRRADGVRGPTSI